MEQSLKTLRGSVNMKSVVFFFPHSQRLTILFWTWHRVYVYIDYLRDSTPGIYLDYIRHNMFVRSVSDSTLLGRATISYS